MHRQTDTGRQQKNPCLHIASHRHTVKTMATHNKVYMGVIIG